MSKKPSNIKDFFTGMILSILLFSFIIPFSNATPTRDVTLDVTVKKNEAGLLKDVKPINNKYFFKQGDEIVMRVKLLNPSKQKIISAETWLSYDAKKFQGIKIDNTDSKFDLITPGENEFVPESSVVRIGRGNTAGGIDDTSITLVDIYFKVLSDKANDTAKMEFYDFQSNELGHTNVNVISGGLPFNVLSATAPKPFQYILNASSIPSSNNGTTPSSNNGNQTGSGSSVPSSYHPATTDLLYPPSNIRVSTNDTSLTLNWDAMLDSRINYYYIYYTTHKDLYLHRKKVYGTSYTFTNLIKGTDYYFVLTSSDSKDNESGYSQEIKVTVGQNNSISFSHDLSRSALDSLNKLSTTAGTGPKENALIIAFLLSCSVYPLYTFIRKNRRKPVY